MSLQHFYLEDQVLGEEVGEVFPLRLSIDDAKHARVLRLASKEHIAVIDAVQDYFECEVVAFDDALPLVRIARRFEAEPDGPTVLLVQGLAKGDKMETVIRHATELGVAGFVPYTADRSIVKLDRKKAAARTERWRAVAKSAAMQSGQRSVPEVCKPALLDEVCGILANASAVLVCWEDAPSHASIDEALERALARGALRSAKWKRCLPAIPEHRSSRSVRLSCAPKRPASWLPRSSCMSSHVRRASWMPGQAGRNAPQGAT